MRLLVLGAGAWGTALAASAAGRHAVTLWARDAAQAGAIGAARENRRYLPGIALPPSLHVEGATDPAALAMEHDLVLVATPMAGLRGMLTQLASTRVPVAWLCKGFEPAEGRPYGLLGHEVQAEVAPALKAGVLTGPSFAQEVARSQPTALVAASAHAEVRDALVAAFHGPALRVYANDDLAGAEVGGAVKNVLAIACGLCDGLSLGLNARAALVTRGLAEMTRLGIALGGRADTFMGLSGLGDLVLTATGDLSRNRQVGLLLAQGRSLQDAVASLGHVAEGVPTARTVVDRAARLGVDMPVAAAVVELLDGRVRPIEAVAALMGRDPAAEYAASPPR
ncbi:NAD(P)H-dependent glycerol-3-phosphate dehydrogenase [Ramlibacter algicola]|uniref:Glycerol-3-phosphate dehydrogenase [NAD(P)+] n=1 Tax=Ramlibacter algicola TaxID=2795217 RepID=A0A934UTC7_9BURK|nr:NAD(P)H-dependent glycerol-3-phosphate dehydrogenase [Ramlibacter algicola]MBK0394402.1 NAD(P)-dependent glycerol-3-phosphate dehydrogenase [Ramlibacter algicola]